MSDYSNDLHIQVRDDHSGVYMEVCPDPDGMGIQLSTHKDKKSLNHYGSVDLIMDVKFARMLASALQNIATHIEKMTGQQTDFYSLRITNRVYDDHQGTFLQVAPCADNSQIIDFRAGGDHNDKKSVEWFGDFNLTFTTDQASLLAQALNLVADSVVEDSTGIPVEA